MLNVVSRSLPFPVSESDEVEAPKEETRLKHRVLDLRRPAMGRNLRLRHQMLKVGGGDSEAGYGEMGCGVKHQGLGPRWQPQAEAPDAESVRGDNSRMWAGRCAGVAELGTSCLEVCVCRLQFKV